MSTLKIHDHHNVAVALGEGEGVARGHKIALCDIPKGELVIKYGAPIGRAPAISSRANGCIRTIFARILTNPPRIPIGTTLGNSPRRAIPSAAFAVHRGVAQAYVKGTPDGVRAMLAPCGRANFF